MLKRLKVRGFKSLLDVEASLSRLVVVFGPNAVGKSNFLEAVLLLSQLVRERTLADAFKPPLRGYPAESFSLPPGGLQELLAEDSTALSLEADLEPPVPAGKQPQDLRYRVAIRIRPQTGALGVVDEYLSRLRRDGAPKGTARLERDGERFVVRRLSEAGQPRHELLGLNHTIVSNQQYSGETRYPDFDRLREELASWHTYYLDPRVAMREPRPPEQVSDLGPRGENIAPFLHRLKHSVDRAGSFRAIRRALHSAIPTVDNLDVDLDPKRGTLDIQVWQNGTPYSSRVISEGTLRVLALCAIAANPWPSRLVAFEEPENGVHPRRIETIVDLLMSMARERQVLVTTHSPTLITALAAAKREMDGRITLLRCTHEGRASKLSPFDPLPILRDTEIREALAGPDDRRVLTEALLRGWLDG